MDPKTTSINLKIPKSLTAALNHLLKTLETEDNSPDSATNQQDLNKFISHIIKDLNNSIQIEEEKP